MSEPSRPSLRAVALRKGDRIRAVLLVADARGGCIDFAREDAVVAVG